MGDACMMTHLATWHPVFLAWLLLVVAGCGPEKNQPVQEPAKEELSFERDIHGLFGKYCFDCHGAEKTEAGLDLRGLEVILKGGEGGPAIVPGKPAESLLLELMESGEMPPDGARPKAEDIELVRRWIAEGARQ